jgi:DGQHR domain-containing protein
VPNRNGNSTLARRALRLNQNQSRPLYLLTLTADELFRVADISKVSRDEAGELIGYQRDEVKNHVDEIVEYLNEDDILFPNSIIIALSSAVRFKSARGPKPTNTDESATPGVLEIPLPKAGRAKPGWIVDGQQRALALSKSKRHDFSVPVNAFVTDEVDLQRDQFLRINNAKPLPRGLVTELLPEVDTTLPPRLAARRIPSHLCDLLNRQEGSPFQGLIRRASTTSEEKRSAVITDTSVISVLQESLGTPSGCLFPYRNLATGETDVESILQILTVYWNSVAEVFPQAWGQSARHSRLMHGVGIKAMGRLMDSVMKSVLDPFDAGAGKRVVGEVALISPVCAWTEGSWEGLNDLAWNELQNVPRHVRMLSNLLIREYYQRKRAA